MFTGLVEQTGVVESLGSSRIAVRPERPFEDPEIGESVAVNGCCLTAERFHRDGSVEFFTLAETLRRTNLGAMKPGAKVNLERAMRPSGRMGGHIVQGHVDSTAKLLVCRQLSDGDYELQVELPEALAPEIALKGSVAIDGVSLTVSDVAEEFFAVRLIPQTRAATALMFRHAGDALNIESDVIAKYLRRQLALLQKESGKVLSLNALHEAGLL